MVLPVAFFAPKGLAPIIFITGLLVVFQTFDGCRTFFAFPQTVSATTGMFGHGRRQKGYGKIAKIMVMTL